MPDSSGTPKSVQSSMYKGGMHTHLYDTSGLRVDENICVPNLEEGNQYKFLGVSETVRQEERMSLECAAKEFLGRMSIIWSSPLSDRNWVTASNQFALPVLAYLMWTQHWPVTELKKLDREARKIIVENGRKYLSGSTAILYIPREMGGRGLRLIEEEYKVTKIKVSVKLYRNGDPAITMVREFEDRAEKLGHSSLVKEAARYAEMGLQLCLEQRSWDAVHEQNWQGKLISTRSEDESLNFDGCFWWLSDWKQCPTHTVTGMFKLFEQLLPTRLYACQKTHADATGEVVGSLCHKARESVAHVLAGSTALAQNKYMTQLNAALKILFFGILQDLGLVDSVPPWYLPLKPKLVYEANNAQTFWDIPLFAEHQEVRANRVDTRIINHESKQVVTLKMCCP